MRVWPLGESLAIGQFVMVEIQGQAGAFVHQPETDTTNFSNAAANETAPWNHHASIRFKRGDGNGCKRSSGLDTISGQSSQQPNVQGRRR